MDFFFLLLERSVYKIFLGMLFFFIRRLFLFSWVIVLVIILDMFVIWIKDIFFLEEFLKFLYLYWNFRDFKWLRIFFFELNILYFIDKWKSRFMRGFICIGKIIELIEFC